MQDQWRKQLEENSGNLTTNAAMPAWISEKLLEEDDSAKDTIQIEGVAFPELEGILGDIPGLEIIAGLQAKKRKDILLCFELCAFPRARDY